MGNFKEDIAKVKAFVFDVDGVLTDGGITPTSDADFLRKYNVKDGYAIAYAIKMGYYVAIITGGRGHLLELRFKMLNVTEFHSNCWDKLTVLKSFMENFSLRSEEVVFMGDDIPDLEAMRHVGIPVCPSNAVSEILVASRYVSQFPGGAGCARDIIEQVLRARGDWAKDSNGVTCVPST